MDIKNWYSDNFETQLFGRYITSEHVRPLLNYYKDLYAIRVAGHSELGKEIHAIEVGNGPEKVLAWSQMHGNESTTTKAMFDLLKLLSGNFGHKEFVDRFKRTYTLCLLPILNPDGAKVYSRENHKGVDLNRWR